MDPIRHPSHNFVYRGPTPEIGDLSCHRGSAEGMSLVTSHWVPTADELKILNEGGSVKLGIWGLEPIPPVSLGVSHEVPNAD